MGTRPYRTYRYKSKDLYAITSRHMDLQSGMWICNQAYTTAASTPISDALEREAWIETVIKVLQEGVDERHRENIEDQEETMTIPEPYKDHEISFSSILDTNEWIVSNTMTAWTYVIDLGYRAFTINGQLHFNLDNMPNELKDYIDGESILHVPEAHLTTVSLWPDPEFDADAVPAEYETHQPLLVGSSGGMGGTHLEYFHLSVELVKTIISDYQGAMKYPEFAYTWPEIVRAGWQIVCAAAPSHLFCPPQSRALSSSEKYFQVLDGYRRNRLLNGMVYASSKYTVEVHFHLSGERIFHVYCWFRSCLITFCLRMDEDAYFKHKICRMVGQLQSNGRTGGIGIVISSFQMVAVAVDGSEVRHSPLLELYNTNGDVQDGVLLLVHLLSPALTTHKLPWTSPPLLPHPNPSATVPEDIIRHILPFTDGESYRFILLLVSRFMRQLCLERPRVGDYILSGINSNGTFMTLKYRGQVTEVRAKLVRTERKELLSGLFGTFQHYQTGVGDFKNITEAAAAKLKDWEPYPRRGLMWDMITGGNDLSRMRI
ncbi:hypothetical protein FRC10_000839 [Ceratobasidium sp. 414]|nr:hypothetical protein FRC10_000839 [Ceratobasidium sp. 414]